MPRKKTHEEYVNELAIKNPNITIIGAYEGVAKHIKARCDKCGHEWFPLANSLLYGSGCPNCPINHKLTQDEFESRLSNANPNVIVIGEYTGSNNHVNVKCKTCGHEWSPTASALMHGDGCIVCAGKAQKTHEQFVEEMKIVHPELTVIGTYITSKTHIKVECKKCGHIWEPTPNKLLRGTGCPKCSGHIKRTNDEFIAQLVAIGSNVTPLEPYIDRRTKILSKCNKCGYEWPASPSHLLQGHGCPQCAGVVQRTHEEFVEHISKISPTIEVIGRYKTSTDRIDVRCKVCGYQWSPVAERLFRGSGCKKCTGTKQKTQEEFLDELKNINPNITTNDQYINSKTKMQFHCSVCGYTWPSSPNCLLRHKTCPNCSRLKSLAFTPDEFKQYIEDRFPDIEVLGKYDGNSVPVLVRCRNCGAEFPIRPARHRGVNAKALRCKTCSDSISYPNKFVRAVLHQVHAKNLIPEWCPDWSKHGLHFYLYDNYFIHDGQEYVVEVDGGFHYEDNKIRNESVEVTQARDREKDRLAAENNVHMIRIDARESSCNYLKNHVCDSELSNIFDLSKVDWNKVEKTAVKSDLVDVCNCYMCGTDTIDEIAKQLNLSSTTVRKYLKHGAEIGLCNYTGRKSSNKEE